MCCSNHVHDVFNCTLQVEIKQAKGKPPKESDIQKENELVTCSKINQQQLDSNQANVAHRHDLPVGDMESRAEMNTEGLKQLTASTVGLKNLINGQDSTLEEGLVEPVAPTTIDTHPPIVVGDIVSSVFVPDDQS